MLGTSVFPWRSSWILSMITTSAWSTASRMSLQTVTLPRRSMPIGIMVGGPARNTWDPMVVSP